MKERHVGSHMKAEGAGHHHKGHGAKRMEHDHHKLVGGIVNNEHSQGIGRVLQRKGDMEMGQHGRMGSRHKEHY